jgi:hypothetical protein
MTHQYKVYPSGSNTHTSLTFQLTFPVYLTTFSCFQAPLELRKVLSATARAFYGVPGCTCHYERVFWTEWDMSYIAVKCWTSWNLCRGLQGTLRGAKSSAQLWGRLGARLSQQWLIVLRNHKVFRLLYSSLLQSQDWINVNGACYFEVSQHMYIQNWNEFRDAAGEAN